MGEGTPISSRKSDHIRINITEDVQSGLTNGLERYHFIHQGLPELDLERVDPGLQLFGRRLKAPLLISSMTGGIAEAAEINAILARTAQAAGLAMGLGSLRAAIEDPSAAGTYQVRKAAPDILLFANLGAIQLNYGYGVEQCRRAVELVEADGLILHLNPLQEALQPGGDTHFAGLLKQIESVCAALSVPVIIKEVGWGISENLASDLVEAGAAAIDVAGAGGTSWSQVEMYRAADESRARIAGAFRRWGIPTAESVKLVRRAAPDLPVFASGGLRDGVDIAKCIALGANLGGIAGPFLKTAAVSLEKTLELAAEITQEIRIAMFACGAANLNALRGIHLLDLRSNTD